MISCLLFILDIFVSLLYILLFSLYPEKIYPSLVGTGNITVSLFIIISLLVKYPPDAFSWRLYFIVWSVFFILLLVVNNA